MATGDSRHKVRDGVFEYRDSSGCLGLARANLASITFSFKNFIVNLQTLVVM